MYETDEYQVVCVKVISGDIAGRNIDVDYNTTSDSANGMLVCVTAYTFVVVPKCIVTKH